MFVFRRLPGDSTEKKLPKPLYIILAISYLVAMLLIYFSTNNVVEDLTDTAIEINNKTSSTGYLDKKEVNVVTDKYGNDLE